MQAWILRAVCVLVGAAFSVALREAGLIALLPLLLAGFVIVLERAVSAASVRAWGPVLVGAGIGLGLTALTDFVLARLFPSTGMERRILIASIGTLFTTIGALSFYHRRDMALLARPNADLRRREPTARILDTSVIIDGRIANICRTGFIQGTLILPRFVLRELQYIADSADTLRRNKGRRGMEVLNDLQANPDLQVEIVEDDFPDIEEVDAKLVALAKMLEAKILTNDYNLKSIAELEGVQVLNVNELANAVKPEIIQGEVMTVRIIREGNEPGQGVAYLDDGTMVVVEQGKDYLQQTLSVEVTSVLQTSAGRMIFARIRDHGRYHK